jgi:hypothetical protein
MYHQVAKVYKENYYLYKKKYCNDSKIKKYFYTGGFQKNGKPLPCVFFAYFNVTNDRYSYGVTSFYKRDDSYSFMEVSMRVLRWDGIYINVL